MAPAPVYWSFSIPCRNWRDFKKHRRGPWHLWTSSW